MWSHIILLGAVGVGWQAMLCIVECLALSLDSMHWLLEEPSPAIPHPTPGCDNHRCLQILPDVLWGAESVSAENHLFFSLPLNPHAYKYSHYH